MENKKENEQESAVAKGAFYFLLTPFYHAWKIADFWLRMPERYARFRAYARAPKQICFKRLAEKRVSLVEAVELIHRLNDSDSPKDRNPVRLFDMWVDLFEQGQSPSWRLPTTDELELVKDELKKDVGHACFGREPKQTILIWAYDRHLLQFTPYPLYGMKKKVDEVAEWEDACASCVRMSACKEFYAYAVSVTVHDKVGQKK